MTHDRPAGEAAEHSHRETPDARQRAPTTPGAVAAPGLGKTPASRRTASHRSVGALQRAAGNKAVSSMLGHAPVAAPTVVPTGGGEALDTETRADMEAELGTDLSAVRIHQGAAADDATNSVGATAYTVGTDVVLSSGRYAPGTGEGRRLLAHELTHVRQQQQGPVSGTDRGDGVQVSDPSDPFEQEASRTAEDIAARPTSRPPVGRAAPVPASASPAAGHSVAGARPVIQTDPIVTAIAAPADIGVGKTAALTATAAGKGKLTWTLTGAPGGVTIVPVGARGARITATAGSIAGAGTAFTATAALTATPADKKTSGPIMLAGIKSVTLAPVPVFPAIGPLVSATGPVDSGEPNRDGVAGNTVNVTATTAPTGRPVTITLVPTGDHAVAGAVITPGAVTGKFVVRTKDDGTAVKLDKTLFINPVPKKVSSVGKPQTFPGAPYGSINMIKFSASDSASALDRGVGETITAGGVDDLGLVPVVNGGPNPAPKLPTTARANFWNDQNTTPAANPTVNLLIDVNKFVGPGVAKTLPAVTKFRQGFHWLAWTGVPNYSSEIDNGFHRRSLVKSGKGFAFVTEQVFPAGAAPVKTDKYIGNKLITFTGFKVTPKVPAASKLAADGVATADVTITSNMAGRSVN
jgi:hypothetical protein